MNYFNTPGEYNHWCPELQHWVHYNDKEHNEDCPACGDPDLKGLKTDSERGLDIDGDKAID